MAAKKVLGNDPFKRSAALRPLRVGAPLPPSTRGPARRPPTPELQQSPGPRAHAASPTGVQLDRVPEPHAGSPSAPVELKAHAGSPIAHEFAGPQGHSSSPAVVLDPAPHAGSPKAHEFAGPQGHGSSPAVVLDPAPHDGSPSTPFEPVAHPDAPTAAAVLQPEASPASLGLLGGLARALRSAAGLASRATTVDEWGKDAQLSASLRPLAELLYEKYWRVRTSGIEQVPTGPCVLVANHAGALPLDGPVLHLALRRERPELAESRWLLEDQVFYAPFVGTLANRLGAVRASPENAHRLLDEGRPLIVFPEGFHGLSKPFADRYRLRRFGRGGYLKIALRAGVPVIPVAIVGGEESMPLLAKLPGGALGVEYLPLTLPPLPARWHLRFGAPIDLSGAPSDPDADLSWVEAKNLEVRDTIESMLKDLLAARQGVFQ
jgi:1-acyl-sn-glycerol-3-phosphate acyltransferase